MGITDFIKRQASNFANGAVKLVSGKKKHPANTTHEFQKTVEHPDGQVETIRSDQKIPEPWSSKSTRQITAIEEKTRAMLGAGESENGTAIVPSTSQSLISRTKQKLKQLHGSTYSQPEGTRDAEFHDYYRPNPYGSKRQPIQPEEILRPNPYGTKRVKQSVLGKAKDKFVAFAGGVKASAQFVEKKAVDVAVKGKHMAQSADAYYTQFKSNPTVQKIQKQSIRQDISLAGNSYIQSFTGQDPAKQYTRIQKKREKKQDLGRKISKKEAKALAKKYGKNWKMAVKQSSSGTYFTNPTNIEKQVIKRQNFLDSQSSIEFGNVFPEPSIPISSSHQPFVSRNLDPTDIEANFMGDRGSGFTERKSQVSWLNSSDSVINPVNFFNSSGIQSTRSKKSKQSDPFAMPILKL